MVPNKPISKDAQVASDYYLVFIFKHKKVKNLVCKFQSGCNSTFTTLQNTDGCLRESPKKRRKDVMLQILKNRFKEESHLNTANLKRMQSKIDHQVVTLSSCIVHVLFKCCKSFMLVPNEALARLLFENVTAAHVL